MESEKVDGEEKEGYIRQEGEKEGDREEVTFLRNESNQFKSLAAAFSPLVRENRDPASFLLYRFLFLLLSPILRLRAEKKLGRGSNWVSPCSCHPLSRRPNSGRTTFVVIIKCPAFKFRRLLLFCSLLFLFFPFSVCFTLNLPFEGSAAVGNNEVVSSGGDEGLGGWWNRLILSIFFGGLQVPEVGESPGGCRGWWVPL